MNEDLKSSLFTIVACVVGIVMAIVYCFLALAATAFFMFTSLALFFGELAFKALEALPNWQTIRTSLCNRIK